MTRIQQPAITLFAIGVIDVGDIMTARGTEMMMPLWMRLFQGVIGHPHFNWQIVRVN